MQKIETPTHCPRCSYKLELVNSQLFCRNTACEAQLQKKIENFCKVLSIKGMGPKTIEKLNLSDLTELFYLDRDEVIAVVGVKVADKLLDEIERSKSADLATVLSAMSIPLVGGTAAKKIAKIVGSIEVINRENCKIAGLGEKVTENLLNWISTEYLEMKEFLPFSFKSNPVDDSNIDVAKTICITGKLTSYKKKADATAILQSKGFNVVESVTKTLRYLVDEEGKGSSKRLRAEEYGIIIVEDLQDFLSKLERENLNDRN